MLTKFLSTLPFILINLQHQSFQVSSFWMIYVNRMIVWLVELEYYLRLASCFDSGCHHYALELRLIDGLRAAESEQESAFFYLFHRFEIDEFVALQTSM